MFMSKILDFFIPTTCCRCFDLKSGTLMVSVVSLIQLVYSAASMEFPDPLISKIFCAHQVSAAILCFFGGWAIMKNQLWLVKSFAYLYCLNAALISGEMIYYPIALNKDKNFYINRCINYFGAPASPEMCELELRKEIHTQIAFSAIFTILAFYFSLIVFGHYRELMKYPSRYSGSHEYDQDSSTTIEIQATESSPTAEQSRNTVTSHPPSWYELPAYEDTPPSYKSPEEEEEQVLPSQEQPQFMNENTHSITVLPSQQHDHDLIISESLQNVLSTESSNN